MAEGNRRKLFYKQNIWLNKALVLITKALFFISINMEEQRNDKNVK